MTLWRLRKILLCKSEVNAYINNMRYPADDVENEGVLQQPLLIEEYGAEKVRLM